MPIKTDKKGVKVMEQYEDIDYKGVRIRIWQDHHAENPREWDNFGKMICFHGRYQLGDKDHGLDIDELQELIKSKEVIALPLYLYDHSAITISTTPFSCQWDSGQVGYIYVEMEEAKKCFTSITGKALMDEAVLMERITSCLNEEVELYNHYIMGDCFGYSLEDPETGEDIEDTTPCWGFYGTDWKENNLLDNAEPEVDNYLEKVA